MKIMKIFVDFHTFMGNEYVSSFFQNWKQACWKAFVSDQKFEILLLSLGVSWDLSQEMTEVLEELVR